MKLFMLRRVHEVVDQRVDRGMGHRQPVEAQEDVLDATHVGDPGVVVDEDEVELIGQPGKAKDEGENHEHFDHLYEERIEFVVNWDNLSGYQPSKRGFDRSIPGSSQMPTHFPSLRRAIPVTRK